MASDAGDAGSDIERSRLVVLNDVAAAVTRAVDRWGLASSVFVHGVWRVLASAYQAAADGMRGQRQRELGGIWSTIEPIATREEMDAKLADYFRLYEALLRDADLILRREAKPLFHFVQPNQYVRGSKPLSAEEKEKYTRNDWSDTVSSGYAHLEAMVRTLRSQGVESYSLADVFRDVDETTYVDACCHLNSLGLSILGRSIADHILASARFGEVPHARDARSDDEGGRLARSKPGSAPR